MMRTPRVPTAGSIRSAVRSMSKRQWLVAYTVLAVGYVIFCMHQPLSMNAFAGHDDFYFVDDARTMLAGDWLGDFNQLTLIKGPGFTYFLVINNLLGFPLSLTLALVFLAACGCLCAAVRRAVALGPIGTFSLFSLLLLQPAVIPNRVIRDGLYHSLFLFVVAGVIFVAFDGRARGRVLRAALAGVAIGWFWITREEGPWIALGVVALFALQGWRFRKVRTGRAGALVSVGVMLLVATVPTIATSAVNKAEYGAFTVTDLASGPFRSAVNELDRIEAGPELRRVPVSREALADAYRVSPAARELQPFLDGEGGLNWSKPTCELYPDQCGELAGGWFGWAVRDAAAAAGHYSSGAEAGRYFDRVADEIRAACGRGTLRCRSNPIPLLPVLTRDTVLDLPGTMVRAARLTAYEDAQPPSIPSAGLREALDETAEILGRPLLSRTADEGFRADSSRWLDLKVALTHVYRVINSVLLVAGLAALLLALVLKWRGRPIGANALVLAAFGWVLYVSRLALIAVVDVTAAPAVNTQYLEPAFLALVLAAFLSLAALASGLRRRSPNVLTESSSDQLASDVVG